MDSDIDFVLLTPSKDRFVVEDEWAAKVIEAVRVSSTAPTDP
jgi:hypothetical protein